MYVHYKVATFHDLHILSKPLEQHFYNIELYNEQQYDLNKFISTVGCKLP